MNPQQTQPAGGYPNGGWYNGQQYWNGQFGNPGQIINPNQQGAGSQVSSTVVAQTNPNNVSYLAGKGAPSNNGGTNPSSGLPSPSTILGGMTLGAPTVPDLTGLYDQYYTNNPDVAAANKSITDIQKQIQDRQTALNSATKDINDNPFYAEATRVGKVNQLNSEAQSDINTLNGTLTTSQTNLANLSAEAQRRVSLAQGQYTLANESWKQNIDEFNTLISQGALENASPQAIAGLSVSTGIPSDLLSSIVRSEQAKNTQLITATDKAGNTTITAVNAKTGQVLHTTSLGGIAGGSGSGGTKLTKAQQLESTYANLVQDVTNGITLKSLIDHYGVPGGLTNQQIYQTYADNSPFGTPKETLAQVKSGQYADLPGFKSKTIN